MEVDLRGRTVLWQWQDEETSPERTKIWIEPKPKTTEKKVPVIYYLSRNGQLEHPHFMEVPLSSPKGLYLRDVINRLNFLRGQGMANMYSWSSKRSYKNGFVWQDLSENDFIYPCHGHEYVLKGSLLLETSLSFRSYETVSSSSTSNINSSETNSSSVDSNSQLIVRKKNQSWSSCSLDDLRTEYQVIYKAKTAGDQSTNAATQTEDKGRQRGTQSAGEEVSFAESSLGGLGSLKRSMEVDGSADIRNQTVENDRPSGRMKASMVLMQLIRCGSIGVKDCESTLNSK